MKLEGDEVMGTMGQWLCRGGFHKWTKWEPEDRQGLIREDELEILYWLVQSNRHCTRENCKVAEAKQVISW